MQHEVPMQLPEAVEGILALRAVVGALLVLVLLLLLPSGLALALPSPTWLSLSLPKHPDFGSWCFLGGCSGTAEPARRRAWWGLPEGGAATELAGLGWGVRGLGCTGSPTGWAPTAPTQALLHFVARVIFGVVSGLLFLLLFIFFLFGVRL